MGQVPILKESGSSEGVSWSRSFRLREAGVEGHGAWTDPSGEPPGDGAALVLSGPEDGPHDPRTGYVRSLGLPPVLPADRDPRPDPVRKSRTRHRRRRTGRSRPTDRKGVRNRNQERAPDPWALLHPCAVA